MPKMSALRCTKGAALAVAGIMAGAVALAAPPAHASLEITLASGGSNFDTGVITGNHYILDQGIGVFTTATQIGNATSLPSLDLGSTEVSSAAAGTLVVTLSENGVGMPTGINAWLSQFSGSFTGAGATLTLQTYLGSTLLDPATPLSSFTTSDTPFKFADTVNATTAAPYSITEVLTIVTTGISSLSLDGQVSSTGGGSNPPNVPEPASLAMLGTALLGFGAFVRRTRKA